jgi:hypothetical protein
MDADVPSQRKDKRSVDLISDDIWIGKDAEVNALIDKLRQIDKNQNRIIFEALVNLFAQYKRKIKNMQIQLDKQSQKYKDLSSKYENKSPVCLDWQATEILDKYANNDIMRRKMINVMDSLQLDRERRINVSKRTALYKLQKRSDMAVWGDLKYVC